MFELILIDAVATRKLALVKSLLLRSSHTVVLSHVAAPYGNYMYIQVIITKCSRRKIRTRIYPRINTATYHNASDSKNIATGVE